MLYTAEEVNYELITNAKIFHIGSISLICDPSRSATLAALNAARENNVLVSYDPNLRLALWPDADAAQDGILSIWKEADLIKVSEEELLFLTGLEDIDDAVDVLWHENLKLLVVTLGRAGCRYFTPDFKGSVEGIKAKAIDTTGAGDGFVAGMLKGISDHPEALKNEALIRDVCLYANAVGALTTTQLGAIPALPTAQELSAFLESQDIKINFD
jgi:fructokinase